MKPIAIVGAIALAVVAWGLPRSAAAQINICNSGDQSLWVAVVSEPGVGRFVWDAAGWYSAGIGHRRYELLCNAWRVGFAHGNWC